MFELKKKFREWGKEGVCVHLAFEKNFENEKSDFFWILKRNFWERMMSKHLASISIESWLILFWFFRDIDISQSKFHDYIDITIFQMWNSIGIPIFEN